MKTIRVFFCVILLQYAPLAVAQRVADFVDPFIGTVGGGNTFPGAMRPWGMVSVSPHNAPGSASGYIYGRKQCTGFGHVHLSGTGCPDLGNVVLSFSRDSGRINALPPPFQLDSEIARPGYYRAVLTDLGMVYEASATLRCGISRIVVQRSGPLRVYIDAGTSLALTLGGGCRIDGPNTVHGVSVSGGFCNESNRQSVYFVARCSRQALRSGTWVGSSGTEGSSVLAADSSVGAWFEFDMKALDTLLVKVGISYTGHPERNLDAELPGWNFDSVRNAAFKEWDRELSRISVTGGTHDDRVKFYTALYHMLIHPSTVSDVNGNYMGMSGTGILNHGYERYSVFSLWDTYRTLHPFLTLVYPERQAAFLRTMLDMYKESGWLPKWELASNETHLMVGDGGVCVIADSYMKGIRDFDLKTAVAAIKKHTRSPSDESARAARPGYDEYLKYGYIPVDQDTTQDWWVWGPVSTTLEYCVADYAAGQMMRQAGESDLAGQLLRRSHYYRSLFDSTTGFLRPKLRSGEWLVPFDPLAMEGSGNWAGSGGPGYVEGNAWQYTWFVPQDVAGLVRLFGGGTALATKLDSCFRRGYFTINDEPDMEYPYMFNDIPGWEHRTRELAEQIMQKDFRADPSGLPGNDDCGTTSGWFVFSAMGLYPDCPGSNTYQLGFPTFDRVVIELNHKYWPGSSLVIEKGNGLKADDRTVEWRWNGENLERPVIDHRRLVMGGELVLRRE